MTEIPEHLLKRSKAAKTGKSGGDDAGAPTAESSSGDAAPVAAADPAAAPAVPTESLPNLDPAPEPVAPEPVYVTASKARRRIPAWALPVVAVLPIWAYTFAGTMQEAPVEDPLFIEGEIFYSEAGCAGCHGGTGGGGTGYQLSDGQVLATFPKPIDMMVHVARGSQAINDQAYGDPDRDGGQRISGGRGSGPMPAQDGQIPQVELEMIVFHERAVLSGEDTSTPGYEEWMEHMREAYESGDSTPIDLDFLLQCADPLYTPEATGEGSSDEDKPCPGPHAEEGEGDDEAAAG